MGKGKTLPAILKMIKRFPDFLYDNELLVRLVLRVMLLIAIFGAGVSFMYEINQKYQEAKIEIENKKVQEQAEKENYQKQIEDKNPGNLVELAITPNYNAGTVKYIFHVIKDGKVIKKVYVSNDGVFTEEQIR
ncbi:hypothetical protein YDYSY3_39330 [Paenibacillus chitinolyticus]|uniref:hypothetical protein n=1 Tax=Paenibacillus chitinolyticus TaxID=79263 RepID=UPI0026E4D51F|nr:hypothetical protein [Paenibacillus chitinolyticus]GKS12933.1 hypothetical protein YDYSY3_39330 [Paenibacillus chitinolyticus]